MQMLNHLFGVFDTFYMVLYNFMIKSAYSGMFRYSVS